MDGRGSVSQTQKLGAKRANAAACEGLCGALAEGWRPGTPRRMRAVWGLCGRRLAREFFEGISRGKTKWEAVPQRKFCGSKPAFLADRKKYKIKGGGR